MNNFSTIVWLLPIVFMIHDFEEIIFFKSWLDKNREYLTKKFPKIAKRLLPRYANLSTSSFALAVAVLFVLLSMITLGSVILNNYLFWLSAFMGFFAHLLMHLGQWIIVKRYIPAIGTTFFALIYCIYTLYVIITNDMFQISEIILCTMIGLGIVGVVLLGVSFLFANKLNKNNETP